MAKEKKDETEPTFESTFPKHNGTRPNAARCVQVVEVECTDQHGKRIYQYWSTSGEIILGEIDEYTHDKWRAWR